MKNHWLEGVKIRSLIEKYKPKRILELGAGGLGNTRQLIDSIEELDFDLVTIDDNELQDRIGHERFTWITGVSFLEMSKMPDESFDFCLLDTDHNSWTVSREVRELNRVMNNSSLIAIHDTEAFSGSNGIYGQYAKHIEPYPYEDIKADNRSYGEAVVEEMSTWKLIAESDFAAGAVVYKRGLE